MTRQARQLLNLAEGVLDPRYAKKLRLEGGNISWGFTAVQMYRSVDRRRSRPNLEEYLLLQRERKIRKYRQSGEWSESRWIRLYEDDVDVSFYEDILLRGSFSGQRFRYSSESKTLEGKMTAFDIHLLRIDRRARKRCFGIPDLEQHLEEKKSEIRAGQQSWRKPWGAYPWHTPLSELLDRFN